MRTSLVVVKLFITLALVTGISGFAYAAPSEGCVLFNNSPVSSITSGFGGGGSNMFAGERVIYTAEPPTNGSPTTITLEAGLQSDPTPDFVDSTSFPGSVSYVFPESNEYQSVARVDTGAATFSVRCIPVPETVPTLSWQGLTMLIMFLTGFAYYRRKRFYG